MFKHKYCLFILIFKLLVSSLVIAGEYDFENLDSEDYITCEATEYLIDPKICDSGSVTILHYTTLREIRLIITCTYRTFNRVVIRELVRQYLHDYGKTNKFEKFSHYSRINDDSYRLHKNGDDGEMMVLYNTYVKINN